MKNQLLFIRAMVLMQMKRSVIPILIGTMALLALPTISCAQKIAGGNDHSLTICTDSTVRAWGYNDYGQLGNGTDTDSNVPVLVSSLTGIIAISAAYDYSLALMNPASGGTVWAWGDNQYGELGNGTNTDSNVPVQVSSLTGISAIGGGQSHSLYLKNDGTVWTSGRNNHGQLGNGTNTDSNVPVQVSSLTGITAIAGGYHQCLVLKNDGTVWAWGDNQYGQLGNGTNIASNVPVQVSSLTGIISIAAGFHSLALKNDSTVWTWGHNANGQLGNGTTTGSNVPVQVSSLTGVIAIAGGMYHSLALKNDGTVWAWGVNSYGQLGNGMSGWYNYYDPFYSSVPVQVSSLTDVAAIAGGGWHSLALKSDGTVWAWGRNWKGELGNGTYDDSNVPVQVTGLCEDLISVNEIKEPFSIVVFPNPSSGNSFINYTLSTPATVSIALYNVLGTKLQQLVNGNQEQGEHNATLDARKLANGVYVLQIRAGDQMAEEKIVLMR